MPQNNDAFAILYTCGTCGKYTFEQEVSIEDFPEDEFRGRCLCEGGPTKPDLGFMSEPGYRIPGLELFPLFSHSERQVTESVPPSQLWFNCQAMIRTTPGGAAVVLLASLIGGERNYSFARLCSRPPLQLRDHFAQVEAYERLQPGPPTA
eukprot:g32800.t1